MPGGRTLGQKHLCALACALMMIAIFPNAAEARVSRAERSAVKRINGMRAEVGLKRLRIDRRLARAADAHSRDMLRAEFFAHASSDGTSTSDRVRRYRRSSLIGETLALMPVLGNTSAAAIVNMWRNSAGHYATLTTRGFRRIGIAKRRGKLFGQKVTVWTADLASRR